MSLGFTSPALDTMSGRVFVGGVRREVPAELLVFDGAAGDASWFSALINIGALLGALCGGWACDLLGQRGALRAGVALVGGCWLWAALASTGPALCAARAAMGLGVGVQSVAAPALIAALAPPHLRGTFGTANAAAILLGVAAVDLVGGSLLRAGPEGELCDWRRLAICVSGVSLFALGASLLLPAPPQARGCIEPRSPVLGEPSSPVSQVSSAGTTVGTSATSVTVGTSSIVLAQDRWWLALVALVTMAWQQISGINAVVFFGQSILEAAGVSSYNILGVSVMVVQLGGILVAALVIERLGRRPLLIASASGMAVAAGALAVLLHASRPPGMAVVASLYCYVLCFSVGLGPVPWLLLPELGLRKELRVRVASVATATNWGCSFAVTGPPLTAMRSACGLSGVFAAFAAVCLAGAVLMAAIVPETKPRRRHGLERHFTM